MDDTASDWKIPDNDKEAIKDCLHNMLSFEERFGNLFSLFLLEGLHN